MEGATTAKCVACGGALHTATTTLTLERAGVAVHFSEVPCRRCESCGEEEFAGPLASELGRVAEVFFQTRALVASLPESVRHVQVDFAKEAAQVAA